MNDLDKLIGKMQREKASIVKPVEKPTEDKEKTEIKENKKFLNYWTKYRC